MLERLRGWRRRLPALSGNALIVLTVAILLAGGNYSFFSRVWQTYAAGGMSAALLSLPLVVGAFTAALLAPFCLGRATKPLLVVLLLCSSLAAYFMDSYGVVINSAMLRNALETNAAEAADLLSWRLLAYLLLLGALPAALVAALPLAWRGWRRELLARARLLLLCGAVVAAAVPAFGGFYASFVREHKPLRAYVNPAYYLTAVARLAGERLGERRPGPLRPVGTDAAIPAGDEDRELVILVLGETARADRFALNGYARDTNPRLRAIPEVVSLPDFWSCDTSTAASLPCMFSHEGAAGRADAQENLLDVLQRAGVNVLWLDNNSDSKGVAARAPYQSFRTPDTNPVCDEECRDEGMLVKLQDYIDAHPRGDIFIVLHQMGNHGPAYYRRYPPAFERFTPACKSRDLGQCSQAEIDNAYDNALLYTDHFLAEVIALLRRNTPHFETAMFYVSDHGESLGEGGVYLHGLPKAVAPVAQLHVPALLWFGASYDEIDLPALRQKRTQRFSHDHLFHTVLGLMEIGTTAYRPELDILNGCRKPED